MIVLSCVGRVMGRSEARKICGASSSLGGARGRGATCKAVIVDRVDDFLYFGAVMLSAEGREAAESGWFRHRERERERE
jgi:hypothetical protein